jgi:hypothetical protein
MRKTGNIIVEFFVSSIEKLIFDWNDDKKMRSRRDYNLNFELDHV